MKNCWVPRRLSEQINGFCIFRMHIYTTMLTEFIQYIYLILIILGLVMLANKLKLAYPIILVLGGLLLSFVKLFSHTIIEQLGDTSLATAIGYGAFHSLII